MTQPSPIARETVSLRKLGPRRVPRAHDARLGADTAVLRRLRALSKISGQLPSLRNEAELLREVVGAVAQYFERPSQVRMFLSDGETTIGYALTDDGVSEVACSGLDALSPAQRDLFIAPLRLPPNGASRGVILTAPLIEGTTLLGLLEVEGAPSAELGQAELDTLAGIAAQSSMAIQHLRATGRLCASQELERDFEVARRVQRSFLPTIPEHMEGLRIAARYQPAFHVGGDFYDVIPAGTGSVLATIGDVSGKGVSGALLMARCMSELRRISATERHPSFVLNALDRALAGQICDDTFVTCASARIDVSRGTVTVANAGHVLPLIRKASGQVRSFGNPSGPPLAMVGGVAYSDELLPFEKGDILLLMTDGILDALHTDGDPLGLRALEELVRRMPPDIYDINARILQAVEERSAARGDDITLLAIERVS